MIDDELERLRIAKLSDNDLVDVTAPHYNQLRVQGDLRDNDTIDDKQLKAAQAPVTSAANAALKLRLKQETYRAEWDYKDTYKADKWAHRDKVREMKRARREIVKRRKTVAKAAREEERLRKKAQKNLHGEALGFVQRETVSWISGKIHTPNQSSPEGRYLSAETECRQEG